MLRLWKIFEVSKVGDYEREEEDANFAIMLLNFDIYSSSVLRGGERP